MDGALQQADPENAEIMLAADVWALGLIAFRLLTGQCFWRAASRDGATLMMLFNEAFVLPMPAASARAAELSVASATSGGFDGWFARCVVRDWRGRFQDAGEACAALEAVRGWAGALHRPGRGSEAHRRGDPQAPEATGARGRRAHGCAVEKRGR